MRKSRLTAGKLVVKSGQGPSCHTLTKVKDVTHAGLLDSYQILLHGNKGPVSDK